MTMAAFRRFSFSRLWPIIGRCSLRRLPMLIRRLSQLGMMALALSAAGTASGTPLNPNTYGTLGTLDVPASATLVIDTGANPPQISGAGSFPGIVQSQIGGP